MKYLFTLLATVSLTACQTPTDTPSTDTTAPTAINAQQVGAQPIDPTNLSRLGDSCGPHTSQLCASGLSCQFEGTQQTAGVCLPTVVNTERECSNEQQPVCGLLRNNKNGYLNECFAQRYGAEVVSQGLCRPDPTVKGSCSAPAISLGNCQNTFVGAAVNPESGKCETVTLVGCSADLAFENLEACENTCTE